LESIFFNKEIFTENKDDIIATTFDLKNKHLTLKSYLLNNKKNLDILTYNKLSNQENASLNKKWMQKNCPTDVLSFPIISDESLNNLDHIELGDIFISLEMALEQSYEYKHSIYREMIWLASHGFLHLFGWDHNNALDLEYMLNFQEYLITRLD